MIFTTPRKDSLVPNTENPHIILKVNLYGENSRRGDLVFPAAPNTDSATNPAFFRKSLFSRPKRIGGIKTTIPLSALLDRFGGQLGISYRNGTFFSGNNRLETPAAIDALLAAHSASQLPEKAEDLARASRVTSCTTDLAQHGIIFNNTRELEDALKVFVSGVWKLASPKDELLKSIFQGDNPGVGVDTPALYAETDRGRLFSLGFELNSSDETAIREIISEVEKTGHFHRDFSYFSKAFYQNDVVVNTIDSKLILSLNAAYVERAPEIQLSNHLGKERSITGARLRFSLTRSETGFIAADFGVLEGIFSPQDVLALAQMASGEIANVGCQCAIGGYLLKIMPTIGSSIYDAYKTIRVGNRIFIDVPYEDASFSLFLESQDQTKQVFGFINAQERDDFLATAEIVRASIQKNTVG